MQKLLADQFNTFTIDEIKELAVSLKNSSSELLNLLENLLHWSMSQIKRLRVTKKSFILRKVVDEVINLHHESAQQKNIQIIPNCNCDVAIYADVEMVKTIIRNLINNAIKFTERRKGLFGLSMSDR